MTNLLPRKQQTRIRREYIYRLAVVSLLTLTVVGIIGGTLLLPSVFATSARSRAVAVQAELIGGIEALEAQAETFELLLDARKKIEIFEQEQTTVADILKDIIAITPASMSLDSFKFENREEGVQVFIVGGTARTRDDLVDFSRDLEKIPYIFDVELPVSNLAANRNINFSITMRIATL